MANGKRNSARSKADNRPPNKFGNYSLQIQPKNENQKKLIQLINDKKVVFAVGSAGTGKSMVSLACGMQKLLNEDFAKLILIREIVPAGRDCGFLPGSLSEKLAPALEHLFDLMGGLINEYQIEQLYQEERIQMKSISYLRGANFDDAFILVDESANLTSKTFNLILTRLGEKSKIVFMGDLLQCDLFGKEKSGLKNILHRTRNMEDVGQVHFTIDDVVRSGFVKKLLMSYEEFSDEDIEKQILQEEKSNNK